MKPRFPLFVLLIATSALVLWFVFKSSEEPQANSGDPVVPRLPVKPTDSMAADEDKMVAGRTDVLVKSEKVGEDPALVSPADKEANLTRRERFKALSARLRPSSVPAAPAGVVDQAVVRPNHTAENHPEGASVGAILDLGPGVQLPAIFLDETPGRTPQIQQAKENLARSFEEELTRELEKIPVEDEKATARAYQKARARSDELYRALFGEAAYTRLGINKASEALQGDAGTITEPRNP